MNNNPSTALQKVYEELKAGNPLIILTILLVLVLSGSMWVWQTTHNLVVYTPTPRFSHPHVVAPRAERVPSFTPMSGAALASVTPLPATATSTPTPTGPLTDLGNGFYAAVYRVPVYPQRHMCGGENCCKSGAAFCTTWI